MRDKIIGVWGITERESDAGLDLFDLITVEHLSEKGYKLFDVASVLDFLRCQLLIKIERENRGCPPEKLGHYVSLNYPREFTHAALLVAECLADYYRTGELTVEECISETEGFKQHAIKEFIITPADLHVLLNELRRVQNPFNEVYQSWADNDTRQKWLTHIQAVYQTLGEHL